MWRSAVAFRNKQGRRGLAAGGIFPMHLPGIGEEGGGVLSSHLLVVYPVSRPALTMAVLNQELLYRCEF